MSHTDAITIWVASLLQLSVACYAMRLNRLFGTTRIGWSLFSAFALLAFLHLVQAASNFLPGDQIEIKIEVVYALTSLLMLIGLVHIETVFKERRRAERQAQKMEAIGQLTEGVAHDFNNILTVIQGQTNLLIMEQTDPQTIAQLNEILAAGNRATVLVRQLMDFGRHRRHLTAPLDLNEVINNLTQMLGRLITKKIALQNACAPNLPPILGDVGMMEQVLMNLAANARDAMPDGGTLTLKTSVMQVEAKQATRHGARPGKFVCLQVRDTGCGMTSDVLARIFEPFFTTKADDKGTGLGLATVREIVREHSGWIEVRSQVGAGTEFLLYFPCAPTPPVKASQTPALVLTGAGNRDAQELTSRPGHFKSYPANAE